jgi:cytoskeletal protein CcmA (bactofilin family)
LKLKFRRKSDLAIEVTKLSSLIDAGVEIVGDVYIRDGLRVDGRIQGDVRCRDDAHGLLVLSENGCIEGSVRVYDAVVNGTVNGDLEVEHFLELQAGARVRGDIRYRKLRMECGASVDGRLECVTSVDGRAERVGETAAESVKADNVVTLPRAQAAEG